MTDLAVPRDQSRLPGADVVLFLTDDGSNASIFASLSVHGFSVATDRNFMVQSADAQRRVDVVVIEIDGNSSLDGLDLCRGIRRHSNVPVLVLSSHTDEATRVLAFEVGADDFLGKPFSTRELIARLRALLRRAGWSTPAPSASEVLFGGALELDERTRTVSLYGQEVALKPKEFDLLVYLARNAGRVISRGEILQHVWGYDVIAGTRTLDVHVRWLREKVEDDASDPRRLLTVRGVGYRFVR